MTSFFGLHKFFIFNSHVSHWQYLNCHSHPRNKETLTESSCINSLAWSTEAVTVTKSSIGTFMKGPYFSKKASLFSAIFSKINTTRGIFQGFYRDFKQHSIAQLYPDFWNPRFFEFPNYSNFFTVPLICLNKHFKFPRILRSPIFWIVCFNHNLPITPNFRILSKKNFGKYEDYFILDFKT